MNRFSIPGILLKSIDCYYILVDYELKIIANNHDAIVPSLKFEPGKCLLDYFDEKYKTKFLLAFETLQKAKEIICVSSKSIELAKENSYINWSICATRNDNNTITGFELLGVLSKPPSKEREIEPANKITGSDFLPDNGSEAYFSFDLDGNILNTTTAFSDLLQFSNDELRNTSFVSLADGPDIPALKNIITRLQNLNNSLEKRAKELEESNAELEQFAYMAAHDLQEPLRMVTSFLQLLEKRYKDKLDQKANEYINHAVDGAGRMKRLILDLLEYSKINSSKSDLEEVDVDEIVTNLKLTYKNFLLETKGTINSKKLPDIKGNQMQILQLFQNIISNSCKYKSSLPPVIDISYEEEKSCYKFSISDNGIGIDPKFFHKIFIIFQRLHNRTEYLGTGIGLAICKKIIDKHGGKIWVTSTPGQGSTFYFTLPKSK